MQSDKPLGLVGLDELGTAIARRLAGDGYTLRVWDRRPEKRAAFAKTRPRIEAVATPTDIGMECEIVISTLDASGLRTAAIGDADRPGFALSLGAGSLIVDMGVSHPVDGRRLAGFLARAGIGVLDAPALGTAQDASEGRLEIPLGGYVEFVDRLQPLLARLGTVIRCGPVGNGHATAALITYARHGAQAAAQDALRLGHACGLSDSLMPEVAAAATVRILDGDPWLAIARQLAADALRDKAAAS
jgi:3-hydroxyisobutyrate dehydrogenase-like beta-hydroxyacid dehydrogenase